jgi:tetratricopeptide (TPR) repeat protein
VLFISGSNTLTWVIYMGKHKKKSVRKTRKSGHSKPPPPPTPKSYKWLLIFCLIACAVVAALWGIKSLSDSDEQIQEGQTPPVLGEQSKPSPVLPELTAEQEIVALNKEELELGEQVIRDFPKTEVSFLLMGNVYRNHGNSTEAEKYWKKALELNPERPDAYNGMGWTAFEKGEYEKAVAYWRKALEIDPKMPAVHNSIAQILIIMGRYDDVIKEAQEELKVTPQSSLSYFLIGQGYLKQKEYKKAKKYYETAIELKPDYINAYYGLITICSRLNLKNEAEKYKATFKKLKAEEKHILMDRNKAFDDLVTVRKNLAETYSDAESIYHKEGFLKEAEKLLQRAVKLDPNSTEYLMRLGFLYQSNNRLEDALQVYKKASDIDPDNTISQMNTGTILVQLNQFADAEKVFQKIIASNPNFFGGYRELAQLYLKTGTKLPEALKLAKTAVELEETAPNYFILSWAYDKNGDIANALSALKKATELDPANLTYRQMYELIQKRNSRGDS